MNRTGNLIIVSGPSGAGKSALSALVLESVPGLKFSISYTTRASRGSERNGVDYFFVSRTEFDALVRGDELLEWAEVYGNLYGTCRRSVDGLLGEGFDVILDIDVQGARTVRQKRPEATTIFVMPPSYQVLRERLEKRQLDKEYVIEQRLKCARREISYYSDYDYLVINDKLEKATEELRAIILGARCRMAARAEFARSIVATFGGMDDDS